MTGQCYNKTDEMMPRDLLKRLQSERLVHTVRHVYRNVKAYRQKMDEAGVTPDDIKGLEDIIKLPFTVKQDLRDNYPYDLFAVPMEDIVRIHASSGTTGKQTVVGYTKNDLNVWGEVMARTLAAGGVKKHDIGHISYGYGLFTGGFGGHAGSETIGCTTIPVSTGNTKRQVTILQDFKPTFICCTPSYALCIAEYLEDNKIPASSLSLRCGFFGAEPWTEGMRREIEARLNIKAFDIYGLSEIIGPGVAYECEYQQGLHVAEDHFYLEIVDPETGVPVPDGEQGEVVFSCITKEALPLLRYRTHDIARKIAEPCECGRTLVRMTKPMGRTDDMLIIRGVNVFPSQIETVLVDMAETAPHYMLIVNREGTLDTLEVAVEIDEAFFSDEIRKMERLSGRIKKEIESALGISVSVRLAEPRSIERSEGKSKRIIDKRKNG